MDSNWQNQFLLAMPALTGSYFGQTIIYLCEHGEHGAMGLVVNRTARNMTLGHLFDQLGIEGQAHREALVLEGGPVQRDHGFVLHSDDLILEGTMRLSNDRALSTSREILTAIAAGSGPERFVVCVGYTGWSGGQLEGEMADNAWLTCPGNSEIIFSTPLDERLRQAGRALGIDFNLMSGTTGRA